MDIGYQNNYICLDLKQTFWILPLLFDKIYDVKKKYEKMWMNDDEEMPYDKYKKMVEKETGPFINKFI